MFALSWVFLAAAIGSLVFGLSQEGLMLIWISIGASVLAMLFMLAGVLRRPVRPATAGAPYGPPPEEAARRPEPARADERPAGRAAKPAAERPPRKAAATRPSKTAAPAAAATTQVVEPEPAPAERKAPARKPAAKKSAAKATTEKKAAAAKPASDRSQVLALPERGTYHLSGCRIVKGRRDTEKITRGTAKRRGYNACGICKPAA